MGSLQRKIEKIMTDDAAAPFSSLPEFICYLFSLVYGAVVRVRTSLYETGVIESEKLPCPVISVGNLTAGGTGKTPLTIYLSRLLKGSGYRVAVLSRGYKGDAEKRGGIVSDGEEILMGEEAAGDEPYLMATSLPGVPVVVGQHRYRAGYQAICRFNPDVLLLDDAFGHIQLKRDLDICLCDARRPLGNGHLIPRGMLREPASHIKRADAVVLTRADNQIRPDSLETIKKYLPGKPVFRCSHIPCGLKEPAAGGIHSVEMLKGKKVLAFSGIAKNESFESMLCGLGASIVRFLPFADHHGYSGNELTGLIDSAKRLKVDYIVTTEKDYVRIEEKMPASFPVLLLVISLSFGEDAKAFEDFVKSRLRIFCAE